MSFYHPVWPEFEFGWRLVAGSVIGFMGAAMGSAGGVGGGGIYVPMLTLIIGFDPKSAAAVSKCMIMGAAGSTVYYNLKQRHPTLDKPLIDYDLALLFQPMLMLGISIGVAFNIIFAEWMITLLLIILFAVTATKALLRGLNTWKKESLAKIEAAKLPESEIQQSAVTVEMSSLNTGEKGIAGSAVEAGEEADKETSQLLNGSSYADDKGLSSSGSAPQDYGVPMLYNIHWPELSLLVFVWVAFFVIQLMKIYVTQCSVEYWLLNFLQVPIAVSVTLFEATNLYRGNRVIASNRKEVMTWRLPQLFLYCCCGIAAGTIVGTLGLGGGFILTPLFLEIGISPQVASATATLSMAFSSSMSVVQYYILKRFPVPYAGYLVSVTMAAAFAGQIIVSRLIALLGRASIIIFVLAATIIASALCLGGVGITHIIEKLDNHEYMGFESFCQTPHS